MTGKNELPFFSIILPTRNRPQLFRAALDSVLGQTFTELEVLVVNDGSSDEFLPSYQAMQAEYDERVKWHYQPQRPNGHGQSYSMNTGAYHARGEYITFLDDDDVWTDRDHLLRAHATIRATHAAPDVLYSNQTAFDSAGREIPIKVWIADLAEKVSPGMLVADDAYQVSTDFLLESAGFAHLNCTIIRRSLYLAMKGMDENIRYECDRDFYLRVIDTADTLYYLPRHVARHNVPDPKKKDNMSTLVSDLKKRLYQVNVLEKAVLLSQRQSVRTHAVAALANTYKHMTSSLLAAGRFDVAAKHAKKALALRYTLKWHAYCAYLSLRGRF